LCLLALGTSCCWAGNGARSDPTCARRTRRDIDHLTRPPRGWRTRGAPNAQPPRVPEGGGTRGG
jgi:hypothetical protein